MAEAVQTCGSCGQPTKPKAARRAPAGLGTAGRAFWREVVKAWDLDPHDLRILGEACHSLDEIERVRTALAEAPSLVTRGSQGQDVEHPLLAALRAHRTVLDKLVARLALPDAAGNPAPTDTQRRSKAATDARWAGRRAQRAREAEADRQAVADVVELRRGSA